MDKLHILSNLWDPKLDSVDGSILCVRLNESHRNSVLKWLLESLDLLKIDDRVFFATAILADQFSLARPASSLPLEASELQLVILASLCCSLKTVDCPLDASIRDFLDHVSGGHVEAKAIFDKEALILETLHWNVITQSPSVYIESFYYALLCEVQDELLEQSTRSRSLPIWAERQLFFSQFLLYLSVFEIGWFHRWRPSVLVSACILTSMFVLSDDQGRDQFSVSSMSEILRNCRWLSPNDVVADLVEETIANWEDALRTNSPSLKSIVTIFRKKMNVSLIRPPSRLIPSGA